ncbi:alcohol dehydrogenase [Bradyrhizobium sp. SSBR45G]|uniref:NADP-dependent oxidoreductase n=1 Tax=unclassified Bradyrhizobium TaxID=2631580 RepID=UPI002342BBFF|nr:MULTISPECIES: NADP-dependent oxidoreductase [unclassified Bradyrhizobium]GLH79802.1 alcohol dehydrogenase [Bradyrhizobium sp. SSBR45G]GLH87079.1 alcohol dehydrogenase [Bradyrhizobium sp. SSBR45R]
MNGKGKQMKAAFLTGFGGNDVVAYGEVPEPVRTADSVLVDVHAAGVNPVEIVIRQGLFAALPENFPIVMGFDVSGTVLDAPANSGFKAGDDVYGRLPNVYGAYAERIAIPSALLASKPKTITHQEAASLPTVALTTWQSFFERARLVAGESLLIQAGAGGIGTFAIQLAKHIGANVAATASANNQDFLRSVGVDKAINYETESFEEAGPYDVVYDGVCGDLVLPSIRSVKPGGRYVGLRRVSDERAWIEYGQTPEAAARIAAHNLPYRKAAEERGVEFHGPLTRPDGGQLAEIAALVDAGQIKPFVSQVFGLRDVAKAYDAMATGRTRGKIVVAVKD